MDKPKNNTRVRNGEISHRTIIWAAVGLPAIILLCFFAWRMAHQFDPSVLVGRWQRPDGGYVIEISRVLPDGRLEARYFNPRPIKVARAEVRRWDRANGFFMELRDRGYPGSTYNLAYLPREDCLAGLYYQAAIRETFEVNFVRIGDVKTE